MESKINDISSSEKELEITLTYDEIKDDLEKEVRNQTKKIQIPGFRKGKVPMPMIKKLYGDALEYEASEKIANARFWKISEEQQIKPIGRPALKEIKFNPGSDLFFKVQYEVIPVIDVQNYQGNTFDVPAFEVKEEDIDREIQYLRTSSRTMEPADKVGDDKNYVLEIEVLRIDENENPFENVKPETLKIDLTNERVQPEIIDNSKGKSTGETFTFSFNDERVTKNENDEETTVTETFKYKAEIKGIEKIILPELTEEFIKKITKDKAATEEEFRELIKKDITNYYNQQTEELLRNKMIQQLLESNDFVPPSTLVNNVLENMIKHEEEHSKKEGWKLDKHEASNRLKKSAENEVKWFLLKDAIKEKESLAITEEDLKKLAETDVEKTGIDVDKLLNYYKSSNHKEKLEDKKLFDFLKEKNTITRTEHKHSHDAH